MGYQRGAYALGYVGDLLDPLQVVRPEIQNLGLGRLENTLERLKKPHGDRVEQKRD
jgi:hypothetical protein